jgi:uncharacterized protein (TIGR02452 family)
MSESAERIGKLIYDKLQTEPSIIFGWNGTVDEMFQMLKKYVTIPVFVENITSGHPPNYEFKLIKMFSRPEYDRVTVWKQTQGKYKDFPIQESLLYETLPTIEMNQLPRNYNTEIVFEKEDCISVALNLKHQGYKPLVLNMADWNVAGGCVEAGSGAQEEECFRRSNYFKFLHQRYYPLKIYDTLYSKGVEYYCGKASDGFLYMKQPETLDMIAAPALHFKRLTPDYKHFQDPKDVEVLENKIRLLFYIGAKEGNDVFVLSAWGCGAFGCPPHHTGKIFRKICDEQKGLFKKIIFAILGSNYNVFKDAFEISP